MDLQAIAQAFTNQQPGDKDGKAANESGLNVESPVGRMMRLMFWGTAVMFGGAGLGAVLRVLGRQGIHPAGEFTPYVEALAVVMAIGGMFLVVYAMMYATRAGLGTKKEKPPKAEPTSELPQNRLPEPVSSVTEQTTDLLERAEVKIPVRNTAPQSE